MSAYLVSAAHIGAIVATARDLGVLGGSELGDRPEVEVGLELYRQNVRSVSARYRDEPLETLPGPVPFVPVHRFLHVEPSDGLAAWPVERFKFVYDYAYQCDQGDGSGWEGSLAADLVSRLFDAFETLGIGEGGEGWDEAAWSPEAFGLGA